jgi:oxygen-independent coproporphyrinogen-3 oxidase
MIKANSSLDSADSIRFSTSDSLEKYIAGQGLERTAVSARAALEETFFLGLRLTRGIDLREIEAEFGNGLFAGVIAESIAIGLMEQIGDTVRLTPRGRLLSNEVFENFIAPAENLT